MAKTEITKPPILPALLEPPATGHIAASAFARFDRGMPPDEVVTELTLPVDTAEYLWRTWARLRGIVLLSAEAGRTLREAVYGNRPIASGADAATAVRRFVERPARPCPRCKSAFREYCTSCPAREAARAGRGRLRVANKKRPARGNLSASPRAVEPTPAREVGVLTDAVVDADAGLAAALAPRSRHLGAIRRECRGRPRRG